MYTHIYIYVYIHIRVYLTDKVCADISMWSICCVRAKSPLIPVAAGFVGSGTRHILPSNTLFARNCSSSVGLEFQSPAITTRC